MRRPLKPFVTEYKNTSRRAAPSLVEPAAPDAERSAFKPSTPWPKFDADDSYEAAMRAADALFSADRSPKRTDDAAPPAAQPAMGSAPHALPDTTEAPAPSRTGGRILRVIDEPPTPEFAALEAEHAPKRRGRKPGSKNKPKVALETVPVVTEAVEFEAKLANASAVRAPRRRAASKVAAAPAPTPIPAVRQTAALPAVAAAPRSEKRPFSEKRSWMRDKPRPGEEWKRRRLPRVCW